MRKSLSVVGVVAAFLMISASAGAEEFAAYYTKIDSGEPVEQYSRTGPYGDLVVEVGTGNVLSGLVRRIDRDAVCYQAGTVEMVEKVIAELVD